MVAKYATAISITQRKLKMFTPTSIFNTPSGDCRDMSEAGLLFDDKVKSYLSLPPNIFDRIYLKVVQVYKDIQTR